MYIYIYIYIYMPPQALRLPVRSAREAELRLLHGVGAARERRGASNIHNNQNDSYDNNNNNDDNTK